MKVTDRAARLSCTASSASTQPAASAHAPAFTSACPAADCLQQQQQPEQPSRQPARQRRLWQKLAVLGVCALALSLLLPVGQAFAASSTASTSGGPLDFVLHLDKHLKGVIDRHGSATYAILFAIVFAETGFVLTPFLPGDSLLFAAGAFCSSGALKLFDVCFVFITAAILGDALNYAIGSKLGQKALSSRLIKQEFVAKTQKFYARFGGKTIVLARFIPIVRTFAPFVAGVGNMAYTRFLAFNVAGAFLWVLLFTGAGAAFGNLPWVKNNFTVVVLAIIAVSVLPVAVEFWNNRREAAGELEAQPGVKSAAQSAPAGLEPSGLAEKLKPGGLADEATPGVGPRTPNFEWITPASSIAPRSPNLEWLMS